MKLFYTFFVKFLTFLLNLPGTKF